ncbi:MAG TPA: MFS transporter [Vicinamibacterales bacterium]|nr:MFS transporter [Vicinamibacterales bacterium]
MTTTTTQQPRSALESLMLAMRSKRTAFVVLQSFASGLPLGLVWVAIPDWMRDIGVDIRVVGLITLAQAPWTFKVLWAPFMDRYVPPFWGRRRGWMAVTQIALLALGLMMAGVGQRPEAIWVVGALSMAIALAAATQDIAIDAYAVEVLRKDEQGAAAGARAAIYRAAYSVAGSVAISLAARLGWPAVNVFLALIYVPMLVITWKSPEPDMQAPSPRTLSEAVWQPFLSFITRPQALEILAFVVLYKLSDQLTQSLTRPFLIDMGYNADQRGVVLGIITLIATFGGAIFGSWLTTLAGLGHSLWIFGFLQLFSNLGYYLLSILGRPIGLALYGAAGFELLASGMGTGAFSVLLLRLTEKRFSATQYALFSSLFALPRVVAGPITGFAVNAVGWPTFFLSTLVIGIPGLLMLHRFAPFGVREPKFEHEGRIAAAPTSRLIGPSIAAAVGLAIVAALLVAVLDAMQATRANPPAAFDIGAAIWRVSHPTNVGGWVQIGGILAFAVIGGLFIGAARVKASSTASS